jgi:hypothetical protein
MSEEAPQTGSQDPPAPDQTKTEAMPADEAQSAPPSGNLGSADPQAPTPIAQSAVDGGVPRPLTERRGSTPGRPGSPEPDAAGDEPPVTGGGGTPDRVAGEASDEGLGGAAGQGDGRPSGEVKADSGGRVNPPTS